MSAPASLASAAPPPPKGKLKFIALGAVLFVLLVAGGAGGAWVYLSRQAPASEAAHEAAPQPKRSAPTYLALETMVVNLADAGGERVAQIGVTLDLDDDKTVSQVKTLLPAIRSRVLLLASQRSSQELLRRDGKEKLADDIAQEVALALGYEVDEPAPRKSAKAAGGEAEDEAPQQRRRAKRRAPPSPVHGVLFTNFIIQ